MRKKEQRLTSNSQSGESSKTSIERTLANEPSSKRENLPVVLRNIVRCRECSLADAIPDEARVAGLDGEDRACSAEVGLIDDIAGGTKIGRDTNTLEDGSGG